MKRSLVVKKSNSLIKSNYNLSLIEHRFLNMCLGRIYKDDAITPETNCKVLLKRFAQDYGIEEREALYQFKKIQKSLPTKKVEDIAESGESIGIVEEIGFVTNEEVVRPALRCFVCCRH